MLASQLPTPAKERSLFSLSRVQTPWERVESCRLAARRYAEGHSPKERMGFAISFCHKAMSAYWHAVRNQMGRKLPIRPWEEETLPLPPSIAAQAAGMGLTAAGVSRDEAGYLLSSLYAVLLPEPIRSRQGTYYTPPAIVNRLLDLVTEAGFDWASGTVLDPACGGGAFLGPVAKRMAEAVRPAGPRSEDVVRSVGRRLGGVEIDDFAAWMSAVLLDVAMMPEYLPGSPRLPQLVSRRDTLALPADWAGDGFDLVVGNPPYGRVRLSQGLRDRYRESLYGHANLYGVFMHQALMLTKKDGIVAFVTPTSFLGGQYFCNLRDLLLRQARPRAIEFITDRSGVFEDVLQETSLVICRVGGKSGNVAVSYAQPKGLTQPCEVTRVGTFAVASGTDAPWILPRESRQIPIVRRLDKMPNRLHDYGYEIKTGPLVWNRHRSQLTSRRGKGAYPLIWAESVRRDGSFRFSWDQRQHVPFITVRADQGHLVTREPCVLVQRTTAKEQDRRLIAACVPKPFLAKHGGAVVENHLNIIRPTAPEPRVDLETIRAILNSALSDSLFRCINGSVAVSAYELSALPLPDWPIVEQVRHAVNSHADQDEVDRLLAAAIGE